MLDNTFAKDDIALIEQMDSEIIKLRKINAQLTESFSILSNCVDITLKNKLDAIHKLKDQYKIVDLCRALNVNRSSYYAHFFRPESPRVKRQKEIRKYIVEIYSICDKRPGCRKIRSILLYKYSIRIHWQTVHRIMRTMDLPKLATKKIKYKKSITDNDELCANHLRRQFNASSPNSVWASDITYLRASNRLYPLCVVMDLFSRKIISYKVSTKADANLVIDTFNKAYEKHFPKGLMFHSDRGTQYTSFAFRKVLDQCNVLQSFSQKGHPYDNAVVESFFKFLKLEEANRRSYTSLKHIISSISNYIDNYYNSLRPHGSLNYLTPNQAEAKFYSNS